MRVALMTFPFAAVRIVAGTMEHRLHVCGLAGILLLMSELDCRGTVEHKLHVRGLADLR